MPPPTFLTSRPDGVCLSIKVVPRASRNEVGPATGAELRLKVTAPPVDAAANEAVLRLLADHLGCPRNAVHLLRGQSSRRKVVLIQGMTPTAVLARLAAEEGATDRKPR